MNNFHPENQEVGCSKGNACKIFIIADIEAVN
jgi:hypothetical protein